MYILNRMSTGILFSSDSMKRYRNDVVIHKVAKLVKENIGEP